jgi:hypothetical protein
MRLQPSLTMLRTGKRRMVNATSAAFKPNVHGRWIPLTIDGEVLEGRYLTCYSLPFSHAALSAALPASPALNASGSATTSATASPTATSASNYNVDIDAVVTQSSSAAANTTEYVVDMECRSPDGMYWGTYTGQIAATSRRPHGHGVLTSADDKYDGEYKDDKKNGLGVYTWADGDKYDGEYKDDKKNSHGVLTWADGDKYDGEWKDDNMHGHGVYTSADGEHEVVAWPRCEYIRQYRRIRRRMEGRQYGPCLS